MADQASNTPAPASAAPEAASTEATGGASQATEVTSHVKGDADTSSEVKEAVDQLSQEAVVEEVKQPDASQKKLYKVKIDGKEMEVDENELLAGYQRAKAANKRFEDAAKERKKAEYFLKLLRTDPVKVLEHPEVGHDVRKLAEDYLAEIIKREKMTPEQREKEELKTKLKALEDEKRTLEESRKQEQIQKLTSFYEEDFTNKIVKALDGSQLPKTPYTVKRMAQHLYNAMERGYELSPVDVVPIVKEEYQNDFNNFLSSLEGDALINILGKNVVDKIRKAELAKVKAKAPAAPVKTKDMTKPEEKKETSNPKKMTMAEFDDEMKKYLK